MFQAIKINNLSLQFVTNALKNNKNFLIDCYNYDYNIKYYFIINNYKKKNNQPKRTFHPCSKIYNFIMDIDNLSLNKYDYNMIERNIDILHLLKNYDKIIDYLLIHNHFNIIYNNEKILDYLKINKNTILLSINELNIDNEYTDIDKLKIEYQKQFKSFNIIFF